MYKTLKLKNKKNHTYISFSSKFIVSIFEIYNFIKIPKLNIKKIHSCINIFLLNFKIKSLNTPRDHPSLYQTYHQFLAGKQGVEPRSTVLETAVLPLNYFPMLAISKYLIINFLRPYLQDPYHIFHYNFA